MMSAITNFVKTLNEDNRKEYIKNVSFRRDELETKILNREINWEYLTLNVFMNESLIEQYCDLNDIAIFKNLCLNSSIGMSFFEKHIDKIHWTNLCLHAPEWFLEKYISYLDWLSTFHNGNIQNKFFLKHKDNIDFKILEENLKGCDLQWVQSIPRNDNVLKLY